MAHQSEWNPFETRERRSKRYQVTFPDCRKQFTHPRTKFSVSRVAEREARDTLKDASIFSSPAFTRTVLND